MAVVKKEITEYKFRSQNVSFSMLYVIGFVAFDNFH